MRRSTTEGVRLARDLPSRRLLNTRPLDEKKGTGDETIAELSRCLDCRHRPHQHSGRGDIRGSGEATEGPSVADRTPQVGEARTRQTDEGDRGRPEGKGHQGGRGSESTGHARRRERTK